MNSMSENQVAEVGVAQPPAAAAPVRRRAPKQDAILAQAVETARQSVMDAAGRDNVGDHLGVDVHEDRLLTHLFDCTMAGYPGWTWFATVARAPRTKHVTVCEVGLLAGEKSLLAPDWVPWEERMQQVKEQEAENASEASGPDTEDDQDRADSSAPTEQGTHEEASEGHAEEREDPTDSAADGGDAQGDEASS